MVSTVLAAAPHVESQVEAMIKQFPPQQDPSLGLMQAEADALMKWAQKGDNMHISEVRDKLTQTMAQLDRSRQSGYPLTLDYVFRSGAEADAAAQHLQSRAVAIRDEIIKQSLPALANDHVAQQELSKLRVDVVKLKGDDNFGYVVLNIGVPDETAQKNAAGHAPLKASPINALIAANPKNRELLTHAATYAGDKWIEGLYLQGPQEIKKHLEFRAGGVKNMELRAAIGEFIDQDMFNPVKYAEMAREKGIGGGLQVA